MDARIYTSLRRARDGAALAASPAEAAPFAYVANSLDGDGTVSVIDTATSPPSVVATVQVGPRCPSHCGGPLAVAVTPWQTCLCH
jgi:YVTN family beta-propeller protein